LEGLGDAIGGGIMGGFEVFKWRLGESSIRVTLVSVCESKEVLLPVVCCSKQRGSENRTVELSREFQVASLPLTLDEAWVDRAAEARA
jgi:hypothetical protein